MPRQMTLMDNGFQRFGKPTRREIFLKSMDDIIPWKDLVELIEPFYPKSEGPGRPAVGVERMLRIYFLQQWYNLSDPAAEDELNGYPALRDFAGVDLGREPAPDETTICKFRHLLERNDLAEKILSTVNEHLARRGINIRTGTIADATIISAPSSTKNKERKRDPEMESTKKANNWYFGMKGHIGVDSETKLIHSVAVTPAKVHDSQVLPELLHGKETRVWGDSAYTGQGEAIREKAPLAEDLTHAKAQRNRKLTEEDKEENKVKSRTRARVEHPFRIIKVQFGFAKTRYRGIRKNAHRFLVACALANMVMARKFLLEKKLQENCV